MRQLAGFMEMRTIWAVKTLNNVTNAVGKMRACCKVRIARWVFLDLLFTFKT